MRKILLLVTVMATSLLAFHNFSMTPDTVYLFETILFHGEYEEVGASASIFFFYDFNDNGVFDEGTDLDVFASEGGGGEMMITDGPSVD
jgi:hypothetical protein